MAGLVLGAAPFVARGLAVPQAFAPVVLAGAAAGAAAETVPRVEDNFLVPLASAAVMFALAHAAGLAMP
jgi:dolichol kinase